MSGTPRILAFAGSSRAGSFNKMLVRAAASIAEEAGAEVTYADLRDFPMPIFDEDLEAEAGLPKTVKDFRSLMKSHHGFLIASPEYNGAISALLKNTIDWASRPAPGEVPLECFQNKTAALMGASPGRLGGIRALPMLRVILSGIGVHVVAKDFGLAGAHEAFDDGGSLKDPGTKEAVALVARTLVERTRPHVT